MVPVYCNDIPVGAVCSRIETNDATKEAKLYIMTMGILAVRFIVSHDPCLNSTVLFSHIGPLVLGPLPSNKFSKLQLRLRPNRDCPLYTSTSKYPTVMQNDSTNVMALKKSALSRVITRRLNQRLHGSWNGRTPRFHLVPSRRVQKSLLQRVTRSLRQRARARAKRERVDSLDARILYGNIFDSVSNHTLE